MAGHLGMTVGELSRRMSSKELTEWIAYTRYFEALPDSWAETGLLTSAILAPYSPAGKAPKAEDFNPIEKAPQHPEQMRSEIEKLRRALG